MAQDRPVNAWMRKLRGSDASRAQFCGPPIWRERKRLQARTSKSLESGHRSRPVSAFVYVSRSFGGIRSMHSWTDSEWRVGSPTKRSSRTFPRLCPVESPALHESAGIPRIHVNFPCFPGDHVGLSRRGSLEFDGPCAQKSQAHRSRLQPRSIFLTFLSAATHRRLLI